MVEILKAQNILQPPPNRLNYHNHSQLLILHSLLQLGCSLLVYLDIINFPPHFTQTEI